MSKNRTTDKARLANKINNMITNGRVEVTTRNELEKYKIGSLISYMNKSNMYRAGGFITKFADEYFIYVTPDFKTKYRVKYANVSKMWVGDVYKVHNDVISAAPTTRFITKFPVIFNDQIIYYAPNNTELKRFCYTEKYTRLLAWDEYFNKQK